MANLASVQGTPVYTACMDKDPKKLERHMYSLRDSGGGVGVERGEGKGEGIRMPSGRGH